MSMGASSSSGAVGARTQSCGDRTLVIQLAPLDAAWRSPDAHRAAVPVDRQPAKLVPKWIVVLGVAVAICGELSWLYFMTPGALFLVPLTRFPGFVWLVAIGLALPATRTENAT
jgi:hypothetical protein